jgi:hypothetical protein
LQALKFLNSINEKLESMGFSWLLLLRRPLGCFQESCWPKWLFNDLAVVCFYTQYVICDGFSDRSHIQLPRRRKVNYTNFSRETPMMERKVWGQKLIATDLWTLPSLSWKICIKLHSLVCNYHKNIKTPSTKRLYLLTVVTRYTMTWIRIYRQNWNWLFSNISHQIDDLTKSNSF